MGKGPVVEEADRLCDERLVQAAIRGDEGAFSLLVARYKRQVFKLASHFAGNAHELDDICQEAFIRAYEHLRTFRGDAPFLHWLRRITINACYDALKRARKDKRNLSLDGMPPELAETMARENVAAREAYDTLMWAMKRLAPDERMVVTLFELEQMPVREIARLTGWSEGNVRVRAHRARQALKRILEVPHG